MVKGKSKFSLYLNKYHVMKTSYA